MKKRNKNHVSVALIIIFSVAFLITSVLFKVYGITGILAQLTGTLLGTIITAIVTLLLLGVQTDKELEHERDSGVFEKKQEIYHNFLKELEDITEDGKITVDSNKDELQKLIYQLGLLQMHADKDVAEEITAYVGEIIGIMSKKSNGSDLDPKKYADLSEKIFAIVKLLRTDLYGNSAGVINPDYFYITLIQSGRFKGTIRNAETMKRLHVKWWDLFIDELKAKRNEFDFIFYCGDECEETDNPKEAIDFFENKNPIIFSLIISNKNNDRICFYFYYDYQTPPVYGFEVESKNKADNDKYIYALPDGFSRSVVKKSGEENSEFGNPDIGAKNIDSKYDIDFYGTNKNYFDFAKANENQKKEIVAAFVDEINNNIEEFLKNLESK